MEVEYLRQIVLLSKTLSFSKTAKQLFISQPALSKHVNSVESYLGVLLFRRNGHTIGLTPAGREFIDHAEKVVQYYDEAISSLKKDSDTGKRLLMIGYTDIMLEEWFVRMTRDLRQLHPNIIIKLVPCKAANRVEMVKNGEVDLAISAFFPSALNDSQISAHALLKSELMLTCPKDHPFAQKKSICMKELKNSKILCPDKEVVDGKPLIDLLKHHGISPYSETCFTSFYEASLMVSMKMGFAFLPNYLNEFSFFNVAFVHVEDMELFAEPTVIWKKKTRDQLIKDLVSEYITEL